MRCTKGNSSASSALHRSANRPGTPRVHLAGQDRYGRLLTHVGRGADDEADDRRHGVKRLARGEEAVEEPAVHQLVEPEGMGLHFGVAHEVGAEPGALGDGVEQGDRDGAQVAEGVLDRPSARATPIPTTASSTSRARGRRLGRAAVLAGDVPVDAGDTAAEPVPPRRETSVPAHRTRRAGQLPPRAPTRGSGMPVDAQGLAGGAPRGEPRRARQRGRRDVPGGCQ